MAEAREATRFAPSPSGRLHVGHVLAAVEARRLAEELGGLCRLHNPDLPAPAIAARIEVLLVLLHGYGMRGVVNPDIDMAAYAEEVEALIETLFSGGGRGA